MRVRKDQKGFTIVEVLIATAILSIVVLTVCAFILVGSRSYASANSDINVQQEAQLSLNQMSDVLIDTTRSVNYVGYDASGTPEKALKDAEFTFTPEDKSLIMYNGVVEENMSPGGTPTTEVKEGNGNKHYHFYWSKEAEKLYYAQQDVKPGDVNPSAVSFPAPPTYDPSNPTALPAGWVELASHVTDFSVDLSQVEEKRVVMLALTFLDGRKEYVTSNNVTIRNKVGVNDAELLPLDRKKTLDVKIMDAPILEPGEEFHFSIPKVSGNNVADKSVTWTVTASGSPTNGTTFIDPANGILRVAVDEPAGTVKVAVTTNAKDSEGNQASCPADVYIKRVTTVNLSLKDSSDTETDDSKNEVSAGEEFTIGSVVGGEKLGVQCNGCTEDISHDHDVVNWRITQGAEAVETVDVGDYKKDTKYRVKTGTAEGTVIKIAATSYLGQPTSRLYPAVDGEITLTVAKSKETAEPYKGKLKYGEQTLDESVREGLPTDFPKYVTAIRVKDNSGKDPDKILLHYTIGGGNNYRICPDLFDLDLNGSYTFYMQAIFPIAEDRYVPGHGGYADDNATIRDEYFNNIKNNTASQGYTGTKYRHGKVFYAKLDRPKLTYKYKEVEYTGKNITYDTVNIYTVGLGSGIVGEIRPTKYENIVEDNSVWNKISNSLYEGEGSSKSGWKGLYYVDEDSVVVHTDGNGNESYSFNYRGNNSLADGSVQIDPRGSMFMKLNSNNNLQKACGSYHIVPGMVYKNNDPGNYEIIGYQGFDFPNLKREARYYEFDDSTIHVELGTNFNLELWSYYDNQFTKGEIHFPTPSEPEFTSYFNQEKLEWQNAKKLDNFLKLVKDSGKTTYYAPSSMKCRYVAADRQVYQLELFYNYYDSTWEKTVEISAGVFQCAADGTKWERKDPGTYDSQLEKGMKPQMSGTLSLWSYHDNQFTEGEIYFPLPSEDDFTSYFDRGNSNWQNAKKLDWFKKRIKGSGTITNYAPSSMKCHYDGKIYHLELFYSYYDSTWNQTVEVSAGVFRCAADGTRWDRETQGTLDEQLESGNTKPQLDGSTADVDFVMSNNHYRGKMYIPLPSEKAFSSTENNGFGFTLRQSAEQSRDWKSLKYQPEGGTNAQDVQFPKISCTYDSAADEYTLRFCVYEYNPNRIEQVASFTCKSDGKRWTQQ